MHDDTTIQEGLLLSLKRRYATIFKKECIAGKPGNHHSANSFFYWEQWIPISCVPLLKDGCKCM